MPSGEVFELEHDPVTIQPSEYAPAGFTPETAAVLTAQEQAVKDSVTPPKRMRLIMYPVAAAGGLFISLFTRTIDSPPKDAILEYAFNGVATSALIIGIVEYLGISPDKKTIKRANKRLADIQQNTIND
jgi:hypothetical protein